ncbi:MAG: hypothetical protein K8R69_05920 [Deltaproteobacteria bacterium]|nr:hypothetical protein [Deltaproteobacteria bacterium]
MSTVCTQVETAFRDAENPDFLQLPPAVFYSLRLHQINAFGYRPDWAAPLLAYVQFSSQEAPYFPVAPETPEAHRHKFLCALALSDNSPGTWMLGEREFQAEDFVAHILESPVKEWGDNSMVPEPSWTLQFLSTFLDEKGRWQGQATPLETVTQDHWQIYFRDFANGDLWHPGKTPFTETGLHFLEAVNKLCLNQPKAFGPIFTDFKQHLLTRLEKSLEDSSVLLSHPDWILQDYRDRVLEITFTQLLVLGHLLEICFHPKGALLPSWEKSETTKLENAAHSLAGLMRSYFEPNVLDLMNEEQKRAYPFPLLHAYHALIFSGIRTR